MRRLATLIVLAWACTAVQAGAWFEEQTLEHDGGTRYYRYYVPDVEPPEGYRVLFLLHGGGGSMRDVLNAGAHAEWPEIADEDGILLIVPNGTDVTTGNPAGDDQHWNDCRGDAVLSNSVADDVGYVRALLDWANASFSIDDQRIYATGSSNGGMMSYRLAFEAGDVFAGIASFIANLPARSDCVGPAYPTAVFVCNGTGETHYMPWDGGCVTANAGCERGTVLSAIETRDFWIDYLNLDPTPTSSIDYPDITPDDLTTASSEGFEGNAEGRELAFYRIDDGGHATPTIDHPRSRLVLQLLGLGNQNEDIEGAREAWAFLSAHTRDGADGRVAPGRVNRLTVGKNPDGTLALAWDRDCGGGTGYAVYRGDLAGGYGSLAPEPGLCGVTDTSATVDPGVPSGEFFVVVPNDGVSEGSYGHAAGSRAPAAMNCYPAGALDGCADVGLD